MKRALVPALVGCAAIGVVVFGAAYFQGRPVRLQVGDVAPDLELPMRAGAPRRLSSLRGSPILLSAFESTCRLCRVQLAEIDALQRRHSALVVLGVAFDRDAPALDELLRSKRVLFDVLRDPEGRAFRAAYGSSEVPLSFLIDAEGRIAAIYRGEVNWRDPEIRSTIERSIQAPGGPA